jgi:hypothetical protein
MHTRAVMKGRRSICVNSLRSVGLDGGARSCKDRDLTRVIGSNWLLAMPNYAL